MTQGAEFFTPWEGDPIVGWASALDQINVVLDFATPARTLAWRGVVNADWSLHSSLYRRLRLALGRIPTEAEQVEFELQSLGRARAVWRYDDAHMSALEILAHVQHYGGPTRLLDVTFNPLVALWFAVELKHDDVGRPKPDTDSRMFAFDVTDRQITLDDLWGSKELPWKRSPAQWESKWPRVWRPPSYNDRIPAQNSAFLLGGIPSIRQGAQYRKAPGRFEDVGQWRNDEIRESTSVPITMNGFLRRPQSRSRPAFTIRVRADSKPEIRRVLEDNFGFNVATIYPDLFGLAQNVGNGVAIR